MDVSLSRRKDVGTLPCAGMELHGIDIADRVIDYLSALGVEYVFGVPGGAIEPLYNAMARSERRGGVRVITARHETGAAFMADGYARETGRIGVCCATTGPGATNLLTGVATAYENKIPLLVITAQTVMAKFGRGAFQESSCTGVDIVGMFQHCTRYNTLVSHPEQIEHKLAAALRKAYGPPAGPVHLSVPMDVLRAAAPLHELSFDPHELTRQAKTFEPGQIVGLLSALRAAKRCVFVLGEGAARAARAIAKVTASMRAEIVTTPHGKGLVYAGQPLYRGVVGFAGHDSARRAVEDERTDLIVCVGATLGEWALSGWGGALQRTKWIQIDADDENFARVAGPHMLIRGDIGAIFDEVAAQMQLHLGARRQGVDGPDVALRSELFEGIRGIELQDPVGYRANAAPIAPPRLMRELARCFSANARFFVDTGNSFAWATHYLHAIGGDVENGDEKATPWIVSAPEFSAMGWAIGAAVGAALATRDRTMVCLTGDGSLLMNGQELTVAVQERLRVVFVVLNDAALGMVKHGQRLAHAEQVGYALPEVDFVALARAMGSPGMAICSPQDFMTEEFSALMRHSGPVLLDVHIDAEAVPPMAARIKDLKGA